MCVEKTQKYIYTYFTRDNKTNAQIASEKLQKKKINNKSRMLVLYWWW